MTDRSDEDRILTGVPVDAEAGPTPGAVAKLRAELRETAKNLPRLASEIADLEDDLRLARDEQVIWRTACDELIDAIRTLTGATP